MAEKPISVVPLLSLCLHRIRSTPPRVIATPPTQPRRAAVSLLIRVSPPPGVTPISPPVPPTLSEFFQFDWVNHPDATPEVLFLQREQEDASHNIKRWSRKEAHVAFPGGRTEADDEGGLYTAMRQTWEEIGIDLAERDYMCIGALDDREITTSMGKRLLMILSPYVFLQLTPNVPPPDPSPSTFLHWVPFSSLISTHTHQPHWSWVTVDTASRLAPRHSTALKFLVQVLVGSMQFPAIVLEPSASSPYVSSPSLSDSHGKKLESGTAHHNDDVQLKLWGLSLGMALDLIAYMTPPEPSFSAPKAESTNGSPISPIMQLPNTNMGAEAVAPRLASVFPRFSYPDVNFWIWVFGKRYREIMRGWEASVRSGGTNDRRINWSGSALSSFYAAIRKALVVVIVARALGVLVGMGWALWWIMS